MKIVTQIERLEPNTSFGEGVRISYTYTDFDKSVIDRVEENVKLSCGGYTTISEVQSKADKEVEDNDER